MWFAGVRRGEWDTQEHREKLLLRIGKALGVSTAEEWRKVSREQVIRAGGSRLLALYDDSLPTALAALLPVAEADAEEQQQSQGSHGPLPATVPQLEHSTRSEVVEEQRKLALRQRNGQRVPRGYWMDAANGRRYLGELAARMGVRKPEDWVNVRYRDVENSGGRGLLARYGTLLAALEALHPEEDFSALAAAQRAPPRHWDSAEERRRFLDEVAAQLGITAPEGWRDVSCHRLASMGGAGLLARYSHSVFRLLQDTYPELDLKAHQCRRKLPQHYWASHANRRAFLEDVARQCHFEAPEDWAGLTAERLAEMGGAHLVRQCGGVLEALQDAFPEHADSWDSLKCRPWVPAEYWRDATHVRRFLDSLKAKYRLVNQEDWQRLSVTQLRAAKGGGLLRQYTLLEALQLAYPDESWDPAIFTGAAAKKSTQRELLLAVRDLLPGMEVLEEYRHPSLSSDSGARKAYSLELDLFIPALNLGIEYNGQQHYKELAFFGPLEMYQKRDQEKRVLCAEHGIRLLVVPYWWDRTAVSLAASLRELLPTVPLPEEVDRQLKDKDVAPIAPGDPSESQTPLRATLDVWPSERDPTGAIVCHKPGGVQVRWLGDDQQLSSRFGRIIPTPAWWAELMPRSDVEGELVLRGGGSLGKLIGSLFLPRVGEMTDHVWEKIHFHGIDMVSSSMTLTERVGQLAQLPSSPAFSAVPHIECTGRAHLDELLASSGEAGILVRSPTASYRGGVPFGPRLRRVQQATMIMCGPSGTWRYLTAQNEDSGALQAVRCSAAQWDSLPPARTLLTVGHFGQWASGRLRLPFLIHAGVESGQIS